MAGEAYRVSFFASVTHPGEAKTVPLARLIAAIRNGRWRDPVGRARVEYQSRGKTLLYAQLKGTFPCFTPGGVFSYRAASKLTQASCLVQGDADGLSPRRLGWALEGLKNDPHIVYVFISPSGAGVKYGFRVPLVTNDAEYRLYFWGSYHYARRIFGFEPDEQNETVSQACYISFDQDAYFNPNADLFTELREKPQKTPTRAPRAAINQVLTPTEPLAFVEDGRAKNRVLWACEALGAARLGEKHATRLRVGRLLGGWIQGGLVAQGSIDTVVTVARLHSDRPQLAEKELQQAVEHGRLTPITRLGQHIRERKQHQKPKSLMSALNKRKSKGRFSR